MDKQEIALDGLLKEMDKMAKRNLPITKVRMNFFTMNRLFSGTIDVFHAAKKRGTKDWPIGAFASTCHKYGPNGYFVLDNSLADGEVCIDTTKTKELK